MNCTTHFSGPCVSLLADRHVNLLLPSTDRSDIMLCAVCVSVLCLCLLSVSMSGSGSVSATLSMIMLWQVRRSDGCGCGRQQRPCCLSWPGALHGTYALPGYGKMKASVTADDP